MNAVITVLGWFVLAIVSSMRFSVQPTLSATERARLVKQGDRHAKREDALLELHRFCRVYSLLFGQCSFQPLLPSVLLPTAS